MGHRIGKCDVCSRAVYGGDGTPANPGRVNHGDKRVPHTHKKPYRVIPDQPHDPRDDEIRDWELASGAWRWT